MSSYVVVLDVNWSDNVQETDCFPDTGYLRLPQVLRLLPVSKSTWWAGVRSGRYPQPTRALGQRITAWRAEDIRAFMQAIAPKANEPATARAQARRTPSPATTPQATYA